MIAPRMLTIKETAKESGLAEYYIRQLVKQDRICYVCAGTKHLINWQKFIDFLNEGESSSSQKS